MLDLAHCRPMMMYVHTECYGVKHTISARSMAKPRYARRTRCCVRARYVCASKVCSQYMSRTMEKRVVFMPKLIINQGYQEQWCHPCGRLVVRLESTLFVQTTARPYFSGCSTLALASVRPSSRKVLEVQQLHPSTIAVQLPKMQVSMIEGAE